MIWSLDFYILLLLLFLWYDEARVWTGLNKEPDGIGIPLLFSLVFLATCLVCSCNNGVNSFMLPELSLVQLYSFNRVNKNSLSMKQLDQFELVHPVPVSIIDQMWWFKLAVEYFLCYFTFQVNTGYTGASICSCCYNQIGRFGFFIPWSDQNYIDSCLNISYENNKRMLSLHMVLLCLNLKAYFFFMVAYF